MRHSLCNKSSEVRKPGTQEHLRSYRREKNKAEQKQSNGDTGEGALHPLISGEKNVSSRWTATVLSIIMRLTR